MKCSSSRTTCAQKLQGPDHCKSVLPRPNPREHLTSGAGAWCGVSNPAEGNPIPTPPHPKLTTNSQLNHHSFACQWLKDGHQPARLGVDGAGQPTLGAAVALQALMRQHAQEGRYMVTLHTQHGLEMVRVCVCVEADTLTQDVR